MRMKQFSYKITDVHGVHARPAGLLVKQTGKYKSEIYVVKNGIEVNARKLIALMGLCIKLGEEVIIKIQGEDEDIAEMEMKEFFKNNL